MLVKSGTAGRGQSEEHDCQGCRCVDTCGRGHVGEGMFAAYEGYVLGCGHLSGKKKD